MLSNLRADAGRFDSVRDEVRQNNHQITTQESFDEGLEENDQGDAESDRADYLGMSRNQSERVELIFLHPSPHLSLRIGGIVFNYGRGEITSQQLEDHARLLKSDPLSSSHTRIQLKLTPEERIRLRERLEADVSRGRYVLFFPYNDCIAMTNCALAESIGVSVPRVANRSQSLTMGYFSLLKASGSDRMGDIIYASKDNQNLTDGVAKAFANGADTLFFAKHGPGLFIGSGAYDRFMGAKSPVFPEK